MTKKEIEIVAFEASECLDELRKLLTDRISELHEVKGGQSERHAFIHYRFHVNESINKIRTIQNQ